MSWFNFANRRYKNSGYADLGKIQIPTLPAFIVLSEQKNKQQYVLSYNLSTNALVFDNNINQVAGYPTRYFDVNGGPTFSDNSGYVLQLNIDNGGFVATFQPCQPQTEKDRDVAPIYARNGNNFREVLFSEFCS